MQEERISRLWGKYIEKTISYGVKPGVARWYVKRVEEYIMAYQDLRLAMHTQHEVESFLHTLGRKSGLKEC